MTEIIGVRFKETGKVYYFDPDGIQAAKGALVVVETANGRECGECMIANSKVEDDQIKRPLRKAIRLAVKEDERRYHEKLKLQQEALQVCEQKIAEHKLDMKLVDAECAFDGSKIIFYFTSDGRVDFRELVRDLASVFHTRIELRQIGVRDEAKMLGGLGICGKEFCCKGFLPDFQPVSIKMAKSQGLSLNPTKISGTCGRLMCCLKYEQDTYEYLAKITPRVGTSVRTPEGTSGTVTEVNLVSGRVKVRMDDAPDIPPAAFTREELSWAGYRPPKPQPQETDEEAEAVPSPTAQQEGDAPQHNRNHNRNRRRHKKADGQQNKEPRNDAQSTEKAQGNQSAKESGEEAKSKHHRNRNRNRRRRPAGGENRDAQTKNQTKPQN
ncbi:MAG: stage 0 sporulation family protein [Clostridia bacterium]|nr:stage 0 sporulation family protein [Clostridia bacterium]